MASGVPIVAWEALVADDDGSNWRTGFLNTIVDDGPNGEDQRGEQPCHDQSLHETNRPARTIGNSQCELVTLGRNARNISDSHSSSLPETPVFYHNEEGSAQDGYYGAFGIPPNRMGCSSVMDADESTATGALEGFETRIRSINESKFEAKAVKKTKNLKEKTCLSTQGSAFEQLNGQENLSAIEMRTEIGIKRRRTAFKRSSSSNSGRRCGDGFKYQGDDSEDDAEDDEDDDEDDDEEHGSAKVGKSKPKRVNNAESCRRRRLRRKADEASLRRNVTKLESDRELYLMRIAELQLEVDSLQMSCEVNLQHENDLLRTEIATHKSYVARIVQAISKQPGMLVEEQIRLVSAATNDAVAQLTGMVHVSLAWPLVYATQHPTGMEMQVYMEFLPKMVSTLEKQRINIRFEIYNAQLSAENLHTCLSQLWLANDHFPPLHGARLQSSPASPWQFSNLSAFDTTVGRIKNSKTSLMKCSRDLLPRASSPLEFTLATSLTRSDLVPSAFVIRRPAGNYPQIAQQSLFQTVDSTLPHHANKVTLPGKFGASNQPSKLQARSLQQPMQSKQRQNPSSTMISKVNSSGANRQAQLQLVEPGVVRCYIHASSSCDKELERAGAINTSTLQSKVVFGHVVTPGANRTVSHSVSAFSYPLGAFSDYLSMDQVVRPDNSLTDLSRQVFTAHFGRIAQEIFYFTDSMQCT